MKKILSIVLATLMFTMLAACGSSAKAETTSTQAVTEAQKETAQSTAASETKAAETAAASAETTAPAQTAAPAETAAQAAAPAETAAQAAASAETEASAAHSDVLVAFFSATGTTKGVAERIASVTGGDLYEIVPANPYSAADLNYNDRSSRSTKEQNDKSARPEIGSADISLEGYTTIYLGFPIWWGEEPRILDTFAEKDKFDGITVIPCCTSGGSGIGRSGPNMAALAGSGTWLDGKRFSGNVSEADLKSWIESLK